MRAAVGGAAAALATWLLLSELGVPQLGGIDAVRWLAVAGAAGGVAGVWRRTATHALAVASIALLIAAVIVVESPAAERLAARLVRVDAGPRSTDAVVVLSSRARGDALDPAAIDRLLGALGAVRAGSAPRLVVTLPARADAIAADQDRVAALAGVPLVRVGPVTSTRDEAVAVAQLAAERGWRTITLVTSPTHSSRAAATFEHVGLTVRSLPSAGRDVPLRALRRGSDRTRLFRAWLYEVVATLVYRARGWT